MRRDFSFFATPSADNSAQGEPTTSNAVTYWKWAALTAGTIAVYAMLPRGKKGPVADEDRRDFDAFLVKQSDAPTGVVVPVKKNKAVRGREAGGGPFEQFLLNHDEDQRDPAVFATFLKSAKLNGTAQTAPVQAPVNIVTERPTPDMIKVLVLYGTEYGFSKEIAELLSSKLRETKLFWSTIVDMAAHPEGYDFSKEQAVLVACSTQGDGVPPTESRHFCEWLFAGKAGPLSHVNFSVCALGDKSYTHFCKCGKTVDAAFETGGAKRLAPRQDVNKEDWKAVNAWIESVLAALPSLGLKTFAELGETCNIDAAPAASAPKRWGKSRPYPATVVAIEGLCNVSSKDDKNTMRVEFDLGTSGMAYLPGDALGIYSTNCQEVVDELLAAAGLEAGCKVPIPSSHYQEEALEGKDSMELGAALAQCYDLRSPKPGIFKLLASLQPVANGTAHANGNGHHATSNGHHAKLPTPTLESLQADEQAQEAYLAARHVSDILRDFLPAGARLSSSQLLPVLRPLQPRLYSISSSPLEHPTRVQATIAEVKYESLGMSRVGVCSTYVSERIAVGQQVPVFISKNPDFRLPAARSRPILMVGPGTGLAPFRAFIKHRLLEEATEPAGQMVLYFGCRRSDQDYLYGDVMEAWAKAGDITLFTAFSREQAGKVYVQQRLRESADLVWQLLHEQEAHFYVCGDASSMAGAVERELLQIFESRLGSGHDAAVAYLDKLSKEERYQRDVWY